MQGASLNLSAPASAKIMNFGEILLVRLLMEFSKSIIHLIPKSGIRYSNKKMISRVYFFSVDYTFMT